MMTTWFMLASVACASAPPLPAVTRTYPSAVVPGDFIMVSGYELGSVSAARIAGHRFIDLVHVNDRLLTAVLPHDAPPGAHPLELFTASGRRVLTPVVVVVEAPQPGPRVAAVASAEATAMPPAGSARLDEFITRAALPDGVALLGRRETTNESESAGKPAVVRQFEETGREFGAQYFLTVNGAYRISAGINQHASPDGARRMFDVAASDIVRAPVRIDAAGVGDTHAAARLVLASGTTQTHVVNVVFARGRYVVTLADFADGPAAPANVALAIARAIDAQIAADSSR